MSNYKSLFVVLLVLFYCVLLYPADTLVISDLKKEIKVLNNFFLFEDAADTLNILTIINNPDQVNFTKNTNKELNFGFSASTIWLKLVIENQYDEPFEYILEIANPDLDYISYYVLSKDSVIDQARTGELRNIDTRLIYHPKYLFPVYLEPGEVKDYYLAINNNGHAFNIPVNFLEKSYFQQVDKKKEIFNWTINGLLLFIVIFNIYLYRSTREWINFYNALTILLAAITILIYDGYSYILNLPLLFEKTKWFFPGLYSVFLLTLTQEFTSYNNKYSNLKRPLNVLKVFAIFAALFYFFKYPLSLVADVGLPVVVLFTLIIIIVITLLSFNWKYPPSHFFLGAYIAICLGLLIHELKEFDLITSGFFIENSIKLGLTFECILLTIAVLERFRINQKNTQKIIETNYKLIENQNKELEIINNELEKLSIVASGTNNSVAIYDASARIEWCNTEFERFYDVSLNQLITKGKDKIEQIIPNKNIHDLFTDCLSSGKPVIFETLVKTPRKKELWVQTTLSPFKRQNTINKVIAIDSDITKLKTYEYNLKKAKDKAEESDRLKSSFLANMSHEIRTPLNGIIGFSELLEIDSKDKEKRQRYIQVIRSNGEQLMRVIEDIMDISLIESNQLRFSEKKFSFNSLIDDILIFYNTYKTTIGKQNVELIRVNRIEKDNDWFYTDPFRIKQVLQNLLKNALKFTKEGSIKLGSYIEGDELLVYVEDTGIGIVEEKREIIFERFRQGEETLTRKYGGTGLGLAISKGIISLLGGRIWLDKSYENGSRFCFTIPISKLIEKKDTSQKEKTRKSNPKNLSNKNLLIVEDHDNSYDYLVEILSPYKLIVTRAKDGKSAINITHKMNFDIVLMDISIPEIDGIKATREIRKIHKKLPIIAQTAHAMLTEREMIMKSGCTDIIFKPINSRVLFEKLNYYLTPSLE